MEETKKRPREGDGANPSSLGLSFGIGGYRTGSLLWHPGSPEGLALLSPFFASPGLFWGGAAFWAACFCQGWGWVPVAGLFSLRLFCKGQSRFYSPVHPASQGGYLLPGIEDLFVAFLFLPMSSITPARFGPHFFLFGHRNLVSFRPSSSLLLGVPLDKDD